MRNPFAIILSAFLCFTLTACDDSGKKPETKLVTASQKLSSDDSLILHNLVEEFGFSQKKIPTRKIDLIQKNNYMHLGKGWSDPEEDHRWAIGTASELFFYTDAGSDIELKFECLPFVYDHNIAQSIKVYLNKTHISEIVTQKGLKLYNIFLPKKHIRKGYNLLEFKYRYAEKPSDHFDCNDTRALSVDFKSISFTEKEFKNRDFTIHKNNNNSIVQQPRTILDYYYRLPTDCNLELAVDHMDSNLSANVAIRSNQDDYLQIKLDQAGVKRIQLDQFANKFVKLSFYAGVADGDHSFGKLADDAVVSWSKIALTKPRNTLPKPLATKTEEALEKFRNKSSELDIIYIIFDAFNAKHASLYGYERKTTPFLDELAKKSIVFENFYANHPYTLASTGTLLTSTYSYEHGLISQTNKLNPILPTLPEYLSEKQIFSFLITSHGYFSEEWGLTRGFTKVFTVNKTLQTLEEIYNSEYAKRQKFIYIHLMPPHEPYNPPKIYRIFTEDSHDPIETDPETLDKLESGEIAATRGRIEYIKGMYDANVFYADHIAESIFNFIQKRNIHKKTIIMITSDHGEAFMEHGFTTHNATIYDEMIHIPLVMTFPEHLETMGLRVAAIASIVDIAPTILDIFNISNEGPFRGQSLVPIIYGKKSKDYIYIETLPTGQRGIRTLNHKFISTLHGNEFYDLVSDPREMDNLLAQEPILSGYYMQKLNAFQEKMTPSFSKNEVDLNSLDEKTVKRLKELGYIK
jgi:arylsulfatase A-like enzyme